MTLTIVPTQATLGARITGVELANLTDGEWAEIHTAFLIYGVLAFPEQHLSESEQGAFARRFGTPEHLSPKQKGANIPISNAKPDGSVAGPDEYQYQILRGNEGWHTDSTYMPLASKVAMLSALVLPTADGAREFADIRAAWDALGSGQQQEFTAYHSLYYSQEQAGYKHTTDNICGLHDQGAPQRPIVKVHPETGRKSIYTGRHAYGLTGMTAEASTRFLAQLLDQACQPPRIYAHQWQGKR